MKKIVFLYDGSFQGMLTAIFEAYKQKVSGDSRIVSTERYLAGFFDDATEIITDIEKSDRVAKGILQKISAEAFRLILTSFLSEIEGVETLILEYINLGFRKGEKINRLIGDDKVFLINSYSQKVGSETHRMKGLIRFKKLMDNSFYASIEPDFNILPLLENHFHKRFGQQNWIIHDLKREKALIHKDGLIELCPVLDWESSPLNDKNTQQSVVSEDEALYASAWKKYFKSIAIKNKINPRLQMQFMPKKYWKHLTEKESF